MTSQELQKTVAEKISQFHDKLRSSESTRSGQVNHCQRRSMNRDNRFFLQDNIGILSEEEITLDV